MTFNYNNFSYTSTSVEDTGGRRRGLLWNVSSSDSNVSLLFGQLPSDSHVSNIDPTSSISWTAPKSSDASKMYNNSGIFEFYNITLIRNTIHNRDFDELFEFKYHRSRTKDWTVKNNECYGIGNSISFGNENFEQGTNI